MLILENKIKKAIPLLQQYQDILLQWQKHVNLISNNSINQIWKRHILDSAQLYFFISDQSSVLLDVGSGGGFPGIVLSILNKILKGPLKQIYLVESDLKKTLFLQEVNRKLDLNINILNQRMENVLVKADIITARAVAPVSELLALVDKNVSRETLMIFPKGQHVDD